MFRIREYSESQPLKKAVARAIDYCITNDILKDFLIQERKAVTMYSLYEYNQVGHLKTIKEEALTDGIAIGKEQGMSLGIDQERARIIATMLKKKKKNGQTPIGGWPFRFTL
jgi:hypothetical protein